MQFCGRTHLLFACLLCACDPRTDIVAKFILHDAAVDGGCAARGNCSAEPDANTPPEPDAAPPEVDASLDAGCGGDRDCGVPPAPGDCAAKSCNVLATQSTFCAASSAPSVVIGDSCDASGYPNFQFAVCTCSDLITNARLEVSSSDPAGASVAINGELRLGSDTTIDGSLYVSGHYGAASTPRISGTFETNAAPRCACDSSKFLNIAALIAARKTDNENAAAQLTATSLSGFSSGRSVTFECGRYAFDRIQGGGLLQMDVRGRVALFVAGDVALDDGLRVTLQPGASLELYVGGNVLVRGRVEAGSTNGAGRVLLAAQGTGTIDIADGFIDGSIYAPNELLVTRGTFQLNGALFVSRAQFGPATTIRYQPPPAAAARCAP